MKSKFDAETIARAASSPRWTALVRSGLDVGAIVTWDPGLLRDTRVLVPIDVQALYVAAGSTEPMVRTPLAISAPDGQDPPAPTPVLEPGTPRPAGVHLHWAPPDALLRGSLADHGPGNRLNLPPLPDRWVVLRMLVPKGATTPRVRGWVLEADKARAVPLDQWPAGAAAIAQSGRTVPAADLTGSIGGSLNWVGTYDAGINRLSFFDPLDDLKAIAPAGVEANQATYLVAGWWSTAALDPLDGAQTTTSLHQRLQSLRWALADDAEGGDRLHIGRMVDRMRRQSFGVEEATRYAPVLDALGAHTRGFEARIQEAITARPVSPVRSIFVDDALRVVQSEPGWPRSALLHGCVHGVPMSGAPPVDNRPKPAEVGLAFGEQGDDIAAAFAAAALGAAADAERRALERLLAAFTGHLLDRVGSADGLVDIEEHEHAASFVARHGGAGGIDRLQSGRQLGGFAAGRQARGAQARAGLSRGKAPLKARVTSFSKTRGDLRQMTLSDQRATMSEWAGVRPDVEPAVEAREVIRPAPRLYLPAEPLLAVRGARRSLRHGGDGRFSTDGLLHCRWPSQIATSVNHVIDAADLLPSLRAGGVPGELLALAREALILNPYLAPWLAAVASKSHGVDPKATSRRMVAEAALRFGVDAVYDGRTAAFQSSATARARSSADLTGQLAADQIRRFSLVAGVDPDPVGVTAWSQPWIPLWLEWEALVEVSDRLDGWRLGPVDDDLDPDDAPPTTARTLRGRCPVTTGTAVTLGSAVCDWLVAEDQRDRDNKGEADEATEAALARIADGIEHLDVLAASLDGIREQLLGFVYDGGLVRRRKGDGTLDAPEKSGSAPMFLRAGTVTLARARLVDAFGRTLDLPLDRVAVPVRSAVPAAPGALRLRPRMTVPARALFRFVDPAADGRDAAEATVDQVDPTRTINPVAGFLLPDHIDEALEVFDVGGAPLGQLMHEPIGGGVVWENAPGRSGPADAGPLFDLEGGARHAGFFAAGVVKADAAARGGAPLAPGKESALSALLRAIDTTLWTVDAFRGLGSEHVAGLVGRPLAVARTRLTLDLVPDLGFTAEDVTAALADRAFTVRVGELTRADDGLVAYFVDDDYEHVHVVDKIIANLALEGGRQRGQLGRYGAQAGVPAIRPILHPYVVAEDELALRPGQTVVLTLLMIPSGKVHLTSGVLPRKSLQLARDWVAPGLSVMAPSARIGPVLIDPTQVRLPKVSAFPKSQVFTRRDTPLTWKDDPILAATQAALLPDLPHDVQEGYIRISPEQEPEQP